MPTPINILIRKAEPEKLTTSKAFMDLTGAFDDAGLISLVLLSYQINFGLLMWLVCLWILNEVRVS